MKQYIAKDLTLNFVKIFIEDRAKGFSLLMLVESLIILLIIFIVLAFLPCSIPVSSSRIQEIKIKNINLAQKDYFIDNRRFASSLKELASNLKKRQVETDNHRDYKLIILANGILISRRIDNNINNSKNLVSQIKYDAKNNVFLRIICRSSDHENSDLKLSPYLIYINKIYLKNAECDSSEI